MYGLHKEYNFMFKDENLIKQASKTLNALSDELPEGININQSISYIDAKSLAHGRYKEAIMTFIQNMSIFNASESLATHNQVRWRNITKQKLSNQSSFRKFMYMIVTLNKMVDNSTRDRKFTWSIVNYATPFK